MAAKFLSYEQHLHLHERWPADCCLCRVENNVLALESKKTELEDKLKEALDALHSLFISNCEETNKHAAEVLQKYGMGE